MQAPWSRGQIEHGIWERQTFINGPCLVRCESTIYRLCAQSDSCLPVWTSKGLEFQCPCGETRHWLGTILILLMIIMVHDHRSPPKKNKASNCTVEALAAFLALTCSQVDGSAGILSAWDVGRYLRLQAHDALLHMPYMIGTMRLAKLKLCILGVARSYRQRIHTCTFNGLNWSDGMLNTSFSDDSQTNRDVSQLMFSE